MMKKRLIAAVLIMSMALTGCSLFEKEEPEQMQYYNLEDIDEGLFIYTKDKCVVPYENIQANFTLGSDGTGTDRNIWLKDNHYMIPTLYADSELLFFSNKTPYQKTFVVEQFMDAGYTLGFASVAGFGSEEEIKENDTPRYSLVIGENICDNSSAAEVFDGAEKNQMILLHSINGEPLIDANFNNCGAFVGLEKDKSYKIGLYIGTKYNETDIVADSNLLYSVDNFEIDIKEVTKDGYVKLNFPKNLPDGYYTIDGGLFYYSSATSDMEG